MKLTDDRVRRCRALLPVVFTLAWPTMLEETMQTAVQYIDTAMVGQLGTDATAAVGSTTTVNWLIGTTVYAFGIGFLSYISQALGAGKGEQAKRASAQSVLMVLLTGCLFTVLTSAFSSRVPAWMQVTAPPWCGTIRISPPEMETEKEVSHQMYRPWSDTSSGVVWLLKFCVARSKDNSVEASKGIRTPRSVTQPHHLSPGSMPTVHSWARRPAVSSNRQKARIPVLFMDGNLNDCQRLFLLIVSDPSGFSGSATAKGTGYSTPLTSSSAFNLSCPEFQSQPSGKYIMPERTPSTSG